MRHGGSWTSCCSRACWRRASPARSPTPTATALGAAPAATCGFVLALLAARTVLILPMAYALGGRARAPLRPHAHHPAALVGRPVCGVRSCSAAVLAGAALVIRAAAWLSPAAWWAPASVVLAAAIVGAAALVPALAARSAAELAPIRRADLAERLTALAARAGAPRSAGPRVEGRAAVGRRDRAAGRARALAPHPGDRRRARHARRRRGGGDRGPRAGAPSARRRMVDGGAWRRVRSRSGLYAAARVLPLAAGAFALKGPGDAAALPLIALVCGGVAAALAPLANVASRAPGAARRPRCAGLDAQRAGPGADAEAPQRRASGRRSAAGLGRGAVPPPSSAWRSGLPQRKSWSVKVQFRTTAGREPEAGSRKPMSGSSRTPATGVILLFEAVSELQQRAIALGPPDQLQPDRQAAGR